MSTTTQHIETTKRTKLIDAYLCCTFTKCLVFDVLDIYVSNRTYATKRATSKLSHKTSNLSELILRRLQENHGAWLSAHNSFGDSRLESCISKIVWNNTDIFAHDPRRDKRNGFSSKTQEQRLTPYEHDQIAVILYSLYDFFDLFAVSLKELNEIEKHCRILKRMILDMRFNLADSYKRETKQYIINPYQARESPVCKYARDALPLLYTHASFLRERLHLDNEVLK